METDPILESMFENEEFETEVAEKRSFDPNYGSGKWVNAQLLDIASQAPSQYGHSIMIKVNLDVNNVAKPMPFVWFLEPPVAPHENGDPDLYEKASKRYQIQLKQLKSLVHATGQWVEFNAKGYKASANWPQAYNDFSTEEKYDKLVNFLRQLVGRGLGLNIKISSYTKQNGETGHRKNVWGIDPRAGSVTERSNPALPF